jgi:hypothetical protein
MAEEFVTKAECFKTHTQIILDFGTIKKALVGDDLRGGIVKDVADTKKDIAEIKNALKKNGDNGSNNGGFGRRERAIVYSSAIASSGLVIAEVLKFIITRSV